MIGALFLFVRVGRQRPAALPMKVVNTAHFIRFGFDTPKLMMGVAGKAKTVVSGPDLLAMSLSNPSAALVGRTGQTSPMRRARLTGSPYLQKCPLAQTSSSKPQRRSRKR